MPISIPIPLVEFILLGPTDDRRQIQDSPLLGDVWVEYGKNPAERLDLLIAPYRTQHAGGVADAIDKDLGYNEDQDWAHIAFLQGFVVAKLTFNEVMSVIAPKTRWWMSRWHKAEDSPTAQATDGSGTLGEPLHDTMPYLADNGRAVLMKILDAASGWHLKPQSLGYLQYPSIERFLALTGLMLWVNQTPIGGPVDESNKTKYVLDMARVHIDEVSALLGEVLLTMLERSGKGFVEDSDADPLIWQVSLNRNAMPAISRSIPAVKADAAKTLFKVNCSEIGWAVIDSGIDGTHPAFMDSEGKSRVKRSFDFKNFRKIVSLSNYKKPIREQNLKVLMEDRDVLKDPPTEQEAHEALERLAIDARSRGPVHWESVRRFIEIKPDSVAAQPQTNHGTHVAGIIGASKDAAKERAKKDNPDFADGMCPDISLYDFRVLGPDMRDAEFAIIAALQFIRYLNDLDNFFTIHGANLSLSIPHDVRNFACGRTPICDECERLVASGVVVVAAAGNHGYKSFETKDGSFDTYAAFSITDPGNADSVLTVGATHRFWPHTYGVSFFSSRGPTGDGRLKPDLVAPGERIKAPFPGNHDRGGDWGDLDGTSMAAPHVSGAAAMLMARYSELIGQPLRVKRVLCESATDLARERSFQGHGMLDVLRAFQSI